MGKKEGEGEYNWSNGCKYVGNWFDNKINGKGIYYYNDGRIYEGEFVDNVKDGKGKMSWKDGRIYYGYFKNDKKNGIGMYIWSDKRVYVGFWKDNKQDGFGKYINPKENSIKYGVWDNGKKKEWLIEDDLINNDNQYHESYESINNFENEIKESNNL